MDTRFWGPDGWKLLHSIAIGYNKDNLYNYLLFFNNLKYVFPCIYCRESFTKFTAELPPDDFLEDSISFSKWIYLLHNKVNAKLRGQGLLSEDDPPFEEIYQRYLSYVSNINNSNCIGMPGWDFIYSVILNYPEDMSAKDVTNERLAGYRIFIDTLPKVLPFDIAREILSSAEPFSPYLTNRKELSTYMHNLEKTLMKEVNCKCISYKDRCNIIESHRAGCKKIDNIATCRVGKSKSDFLKKI